MKVKFLLWLGLAVVLFISGCSKLTEVKAQFMEVQSLHVSPTEADVPLGSDFQFYAIAVGKDGTAQKVQAAWVASSNLGTIDKNGLFKSSTLANYGTVIAQYGAFRASATVNVKPGTVIALVIVPGAATLEVGGALPFSVRGRDQYGNQLSVSANWSVEGGIGTVEDSSYYYSSSVQFFSATNSAQVYFSAGAAGDGFLKAQYGSLEAKVPIHVVAYTPYTYVLQWRTTMEVGNANPQGVAVGPDGNIWVTMYSYNGGDYYVGQVAKYDTAGNFMGTLESNVSGEGGFAAPSDLAFDSTGNMYVVDYRNDVVKKYDSSGKYVLQWGGNGRTAGKFYHPERIAIDASNNIYVTDSINYRVQKFTPAGVYLTEWGDYGIDDGEFVHPTGIAVDSAGNVYVADERTCRVQKFDSTGNFISKWGTQGSAVGEFGGIKGMAIDSSGNFFIADGDSERIVKCDSAGNTLTRWGSYGTAAGKFNSPLDVAVDSSGNVYVVDSYNYRIQKFKP